MLKKMCAGKNCMFWEDESCLFVEFFKKSAVSTFEGEETENFPIDVEVRKKKIPEDIKLMSAEELAEELVEYVRKQFPDNVNMVYSVKDIFWKSKGLEDTWDIPLEIKLKIQQTELLADNKIAEENKKLEKIRLEKEKEQLPDLIEDCITWAQGLGFNKITKSDLDTFLMEREIQLLKFSSDYLHNKVNLRLKSMK
jgi:hypothetical protein